MTMKKSTLVIGVGNPFRSDDRAGLEVARRIKPHSNDHVTVLEFTSNPLALLDLWNGYEEVLLADAISSKSEPGTFQLINAAQQTIPSGLFNTSSHNLGVAEAIEISRSLGRLPKQLWIYGIEGDNFEYGTTLSSKIERAIETVVKEILSRIQ
jgi:hydrogenase maturation protease